MMNIDTLTDQEKSVLLAKAMGKYENVALLQVVDALVDGNRKHYWTHNGIIEQIPDLYAPASMALAIRVIVWGFENDEPFNEWLSDKTTALEVLIQEHGIRRALDYLVEPPAIEAGLVELEEERG